jgi:micrococcal nuclease
VADLGSTTTASEPSTTSTTAASTTTLPPTAVVPLAPSTTTSSGVPEETVTVTRIIDGDTLDVRFGDGTVDRVRLIGIDGPEPGQPFAAQASAHLASLVEGREVVMVSDVSDRDRFDRLLGYLFVGSLFVNEEMVRAGWAWAVRYPPDTAMALVLEAAQEQAQTAGVGLWATTTTTSGRGANCDPSYPDVCIPPYPPDLDCGDIPHRRFRVLPPDPHGFDGDKDGIGCESG